MADRDEMGGASGMHGSDMDSAFLCEKETTLEHLGVDIRIILTFRRLMSYIYGAPILDVSRSHTTTQHSR